MSKEHASKNSSTIVATFLACLLLVACAPDSAPTSSETPAAVCPATPTASASIARTHDSAARFANESWESLAARPAEATFIPQALTPRAFAVPYAEGYDRGALPEWRGTLDELVAAFEFSRDELRYADRDHSNFKRRATWLYPYDGCASRAAHVTRRMTERGVLPPAKLFAFGNLKVKTPFQKGGTAYWWYHTAPAYRVAGETYVMDASVDSKRLLTLHEWLSRMSSRPSTVKLAICDSKAFNAESICHGGPDDQDRDYERNIRSYLSKEWMNLESLGFDPRRLLGPEPPWDVEPVPNEARCPTAAASGR